MVKKSKLLAALDAHQGRDYKLEKQRTLQKQAAKRKRVAIASQDSANQSEAETSALVEADGAIPRLEEESVGWESDESEDVTVHGGEPTATSAIDQLESDLDEEDTQDSDIALSDIDSLSSEEKGDLVPHQRLTINNTSALLKAYKSIALPLSTIPFSAHQSITSSAQVSIPDINDDLNRELAFYKQCLDATTEARTRLNGEGVPFSRPTDFFAEMVKSDEHMGKIKSKMTEEAAGKKAAAEARRQRDLKKFGKQVQVAKLQERDKAKRETLDKINILKRKRRDTDTGKANEEDLFDIALEDETKGDRASRSARKDGREGSRDKRQKKDAKFGFGGKKRFAKSGNAESTGDLRGFSSKKMKGKKAPPRLGKSRRAHT